MSELTQCNYCSLQRIRARAKREGKVVTLIPGGIGVDVFVHPEYVGLTGKVRIPANHRDSGGDLYSRYEKYFVASMMEIPDRCCC